jgi:hydrogenase maturation protease
MNHIGIIGLGNPLRHDDGIGLELLRCLEKHKSEFSRNIEYIDGGIGGVNLLHLFPRFSLVLLIDAVDFKGKPGETHVFTLHDLLYKKTPVLTTSHETDFLNIITLSRELNELPRDLFVFGVQPSDVSFGRGLSEVLQPLVQGLCEKLCEELHIILTKHGKNHELSD